MTTPGGGFRGLLTQGWSVKRTECRPQLWDEGAEARSPGPWSCRNSQVLEMLKEPCWRKSHPLPANARATGKDQTPAHPAGRPPLAGPRKGGWRTPVTAQGREWRLPCSLPVPPGQ